MNLCASRVWVPEPPAPTWAPEPVEGPSPVIRTWVPEPSALTCAPEPSAPTWVPEPVQGSVIGVPRTPPAARFRALDRAAQRGRRHADVGQAELSARRVLQAQILDVHPELTQLREQASELARGVVDHDDELLEAAVLTVLAWQALHTFIALTDRVG